MLAVDRLASVQPLHGGILGRWRLVEDPSIKTMAVGFSHGRLILYFSPVFVEGITLDQLTAVLSHEANHVLFGHCEHDPLPNENHRAMTIAEEITVNEWVTGTLPCNPIVLADYPALLENEDTQTRYDRLLAILPDQKKTLDDHSRWEQIRSNGQLANAVINTIVSQAWAKMTPEQRAKVQLPQQIQKIVEDAIKSCNGASAVGNGMASVPWKKVLRRYVGRAMMRRPMFTRPPRRFPDMVGILPARGRSGSKPKVMAVIDTSGSMSAAILSDISAELAMMNRTHEVLVVECDEEIRSTYRYRPISEIQGRRGTNFRPPLAPEFLRIHRPDVVIYFTDGCGKTPAIPPKVPVIWCLTERGKQPCGWGKVLRMA